MRINNPLFLSVLFMGLFYLTPINTYSKTTSCECPQIKCGPCEKVDGLDFYTAKCEGGAKMMSCAKEKCLPLEDPPEQCLAKNKDKKRSVASVEKKVKVLPGPIKYANAQVEIGKVEVTKGKVWVVDFRGKKQVLKVGMKVYESDTMITGTDGQVKIIFKDSNEVHINESSKVEISQYNASGQIKKRRALLNLLRGKIRSRVKKKYEGKNTSFFRVKTKSAVAGVRGTDFVVGFDVGRGEITKVETLKGEVMLGDTSNEKKVNLKAGQYASYVTKKKSVFSDKEMDEFVQKGYLTPVYRLSAQEVKNLDIATRVISVPSDGVRQVSSVAKKMQNICSSPRADLNQCSWSCENNPKGARTCRTDLSEVKCVRRRCNANGIWAEEYRVPANHTEHCKSPRVTVGNCNY